MRRPIAFAAAYATLPVFALIALPVLADSYDNSYLPPPGPVSYAETLRQVEQLPAFRAQLLEDQDFRHRARATEVAAATPPQIQPVRNYQVPAIPDYLPMSRVDAQRAPIAAAPAATAGGMPATYGSAAYAAYSGAENVNYQQAGFIQQSGTPNAGASAPAGNAPAYGAGYGGGYAANSYAQAQNAQAQNQNRQGQNAQPSSPLLAQEPAYAPQAQMAYPTPAYGAPAYPAPVYGAPVYGAPAPYGAPMYTAPYAEPVPVPAPAMVAPTPEYVPAPQAVPVYPGQQPYAPPAPVVDVAPVSPGVQMTAPVTEQQLTMAYNPPVMQGNPHYEYVDAPKPRPAAEPIPGRQGFFVTLRSGVVFGDDTDFDTAGGAVTYENAYHTGWNVSGGLGYAFRPFNRLLAPRAEVEFGTIRQSIQKQTVNGLEFQDPNAYGTTDTLATIFSGYLDLFPYNRYFVPYLGGGVGFGFTDFNRHGVTSPVMSDSAFGFAWQAAAGVGIQVARSSMLDIGYRYLQSPGVSLAARDGTASETDVGAHMIMVGYRQGF